jgi:hypothetical protein
MSQKMTTFDVANHLDPNGKSVMVAEILNKSSSILSVAPTKPTNKTDTHTGTVRIYLPTGTRIGYGEATTVDKSGSAIITDTTSKLSSGYMIPKDVAEMGGNPTEVLKAEGEAHIEGMGQTLQNDIFYGNNKTNPKQLTGFTARYNSKEEDDARQRQQIIDCGGTGSDNASIWFIAWHPDNCHLLYPKGSKAGIQAENYGVTPDTITENGKTKIQANYKAEFFANIGLHIKDYRHAVRLANIDVSDLENSDPINLIEKFNLALVKMGIVTSKGNCNLQVYMNEDVYSAFVNQIETKSNLNYTIEQLENGRLITKFKGVTINQEDALLSTESQVV